MARAMKISQKPHHWAELAAAAPFVALIRWYEVALDRRALKEMPSERLADIGLTRTDVQREVTRPFWDVALDC